MARLTDNLTGSGYSMASPAKQIATPLGAAEVAATRYLIGDGSSPFVNSAYLFHGCAAIQAAGDTLFRDMSGANNGTFGANLSRTQAWAARASGFISTVNPAGAAEDSVLKIPGPNLDYSAGESLLILWAGQVTPEGSNAHLMGTAGDPSEKGVTLQVQTTGELLVRLYNASTNSDITTTTTTAAGRPFVTGETHSFAVFIDGQSRVGSVWVDEVINRDSISINSGEAFDTLSSAVWTIGKARPVDLSTTGIATATQYFLMLKFGATDALPTNAQILAAAKQVRASPHALLLPGAL